MKNTKTMISTIYSTNTSELCKWYENRTIMWDRKHKSCWAQMGFFKQIFFFSHYHPYFKKRMSKDFFENRTHTWICVILSQQSLNSLKQRVNHVQSVYYIYASAGRWNAVARNYIFMFSLHLWSLLKYNFFIIIFFLPIPLLFLALLLCTAVAWCSSCRCYSWSISSVGSWGCCIGGATG